VAQQKLHYFQAATLGAVVQGRVALDTFSVQVSAWKIKAQLEACG